jgi:hypothetical protein
VRRKFNNIMIIAYAPTAEKDDISIDCFYEEHGIIYYRPPAHDTKINWEI